MNLLLVEERADRYEFAPEHPRYPSVDRLAGPEVCLGVAGGERGVGRLEGEPGGVRRITGVRWERSPPPSPPPLDLVVGLPRPAEARRILFLAGEWGIRSLSFVVTDRTPAGYAGSRVLRPEPAGAVLREGMEQGFHTRLPRFALRAEGLAEVLAGAAADRPTTVLDPYLGTEALAAGPTRTPPGTLVFGGERGFSPREQEWIRSAGVRLRHLGPVVLRSGTAVATALPLVFGAAGFLGSSAGARLGPLG